MHYNSIIVVIIVKIIFMSSFLLCCLLYNHSFKTNPNSITNLSKLFNYTAPASLFLYIFQVQDEDFYSSTLANVPKMIIGKRTREETALAANNNSRIWNPAQLEHVNLIRNPWSNTEKIIYLAKFLEYPKEFWKIATYLTNKTTNDCISFYYRIKKRIDLKALLKKQTVLRTAYRSTRNKDPEEARADERYGEEYLDNKGNVKQQSLLRASMWSGK